MQVPLGSRIISGQNVQVAVGLLAGDGREETPWSWDTLAESEAERREWGLCRRLEYG